MNRSLLRSVACGGALAVGLLSVGTTHAWAQRGARGPAEHANVTPINNLPNPYETRRDWGTLPDGREWGSVSAL